VVEVHQPLPYLYRFIQGRLTERRGSVSDTPASCYGGLSHFQMSAPRFFARFLSKSKNIPQQLLKSGHEGFLPHPSQFTGHERSVHSVLHSPRYTQRREPYICKAYCQNKRLGRLYSKRGTPVNILAATNTGNRKTAVSMPRPVNTFPLINVTRENSLL
jgi:hypothetical protein